MTSYRRLLFLSLGLAACGETDTTVGRSFVAIGDACTGYDECAKVAGEVVACRCTPERDVPVCVVEWDVGEDCRQAGNIYRPCAPGAACNEALDGSAICVANGTLGESCDGNLPCAAPFACSAERLCALGTSAVGAACTEDSSCEPPNHCDGASGRCVGPGAIGAPCQARSERNPCVNGTHCLADSWDPDDPLVNTCIALKRDGAECIDDAECQAKVCFFDRCGRGSLPGNVHPECG